MYIKQATVNNQVGLHARPATFFIQKANEFKSTIWVEKDEQMLNALNNVYVKGKANLANLSGSIAILEEVADVLNNAEIVEATSKSAEK